MFDCILSIGRRPITDRHAGVLCHRAIGGLLSDGHRTPSFRDITDAADRVLAALPAPSRQAARVRLISCIGTYFRRFLPPAPWQLEGAEVSVRGARLDLVFGHPNGDRFSDEIKTGRLTRAIDEARLEEQLDRSLAGARIAYGEQFLGIRALILGRPDASFAFTLAGDTLPSLTRALHA